MLDYQQKNHIFTFTFSLFIVIAIHKKREKRFIFIYIFINIYLNICFSVNISTPKCENVNVKMWRFPLLASGLCSAEPTVAGRRVKQFPNSAAASISIYNARKIIGLQILIFGPAEPTVAGRRVKQLQIRQNQRHARSHPFGRGRGVGSNFIKKC